MRRVSLVGPLILIFIGAVFLIHNLNPNLPVAEWFSQFWPFLLIGWGVLRLIEIATLAVLRKPLPANGIGGGEWALIVLLFVIGTGVSAVHARGWPPPGVHFGGWDVFGDAFDYPVTGEATAVGNTPRIVIESFRGNARIVGSDTADVKATGRKTVRALKRADADLANNQTPFEVVKNGNDVVIRTNQDRVDNNQRVSADLEITVPKGSSIEARGRYGDFEISDLNGAVDIASDNAGVRLQNINGDVKVETRRSDIVRAVNVKGRVELKGRGGDLELSDIDGPVTVSATYTGMVQMKNIAQPVRYEAPQTELQFEKLPGELRMSVGDLNATNIVGPIRLSARAKDVQINDFTQGAEITVHRGDIELRPGKTFAKMNIRTDSGDIDLAVPPEARFEVDASTRRGEITNDLGDAFKLEQSGDGATLRGAIGTSAPVVKLATDRGSVTLRKSQGEQTAHEMPMRGPKPPKMAEPPAPPLPPAREQ